MTMAKKITGSEQPLDTTQIWDSGGNPIYSGELVMQPRYEPFEPEEDWSGLQSGTDTPIVEDLGVATGENYIPPPRNDVNKE